MKQNYVTPIAEATDLRLENALLASSGWDSSSRSSRSSDCPCNKRPYGRN